MKLNSDPDKLHKLSKAFGLDNCILKDAEYHETDRACVVTARTEDTVVTLAHEFTSGKSFAKVSTKIDGRQKFEPINADAGEILAVARDLMPPLKLDKLKLIL